MTLPGTPTDKPTTNPANLKDLPPLEANGHNGTAQALKARRPQARKWRRGVVLLGAGGGVLFVGVVLLLYWWIADPFRRVRTDLEKRPVHYERLELNIVERGTLESAKNSDIYCTVKAGMKGANNASTIKWVIDDGSSVKKGDLVVDLDDSGLQDQLKTEKIALDGAEADKIKADEDHKITVSQNESDIKSAEVKLELSKIDLQKYREGDFPQQLKDVDGKIKQAEGDVDQQRDRAAWANRMVKKGYMTAVQSQAEQSKLESLELVLAGFAEQKRVLTDPTYGLRKRTETDLKNQVAENERALERVKFQATSKEAQARSLREAKKSIYEQELVKYKDILGEIKKWKIYAPQNGMVVYYVPEQARFGGGAQQGIVAQGEPVREGQKLMQIPNLKSMLVNTKVHEALVSKVKKHQPALIRVDSFPDRLLQGHVETVATVSSSQDFMAADVKVYQTKVMIDDVPDGLRPGMSAEVTVTVAAALEHVLTVPVQAIVGSADLGKKRKCYVENVPGMVEEREILVGQSNEKMAEIKEGLKEGDLVVLNPRAIVGDKAKVREGRGGDDKGGRSGEGGKEKKDRGPGGMEKAPPGPGNDGGEKKSSDEDRQKKQAERMEKFRKASPEERKKMLEEIPEAYRDKVRESLKAQGIEVKE